MSKCTSSVGRFDSHSGAPEKYRRDCLIAASSGYSGSHWKPLSGDYLLHIAPAAARAIANKTATKKCTNKAGHFNGHGALLDATKRRHQASIAAYSCNWSSVPWFFQVFSS
jgi:hypothetical protein